MNSIRTLFPPLYLKLTSWNPTILTFFSLKISTKSTADLSIPLTSYEPRVIVFTLISEFSDIFTDALPPGLWYSRLSDHTIDIIGTNAYPFTDVIASLMLTNPLAWQLSFSRIHQTPKPLSKTSYWQSHRQYGWLLCFLQNWLTLWLSSNHTLCLLTDTSQHSTLTFWVFSMARHAIRHL